MSRSDLSRRAVRLHGAVCGTVLLLALAGCAGRTARPKDPVLSDRPLPGSARVLPSEQSRSEAGIGAKEAFPLPGQGAGDPDRRTPERHGGSELGGREVPPPPAAGTAPIREAPKDEPVTADAERGFSVQLWVTTSKEAAEDRRAAMERALGVPVRVEARDGMYRVRAGTFAEEGEADALRRRAITAGSADARIVSTP